MKIGAIRIHIDGDPEEKVDSFRQVLNVKNATLNARYAKGGNEVDLRLWADRGAFGWRQDDVFMAYIGQKGEVKEYVAKRARAKHEKSGFPAFWGPNYDWVPDQDHGSILMKALQSMLMQVDGRRIYLLPAWPREWDVEFQLHAPFRTIIVGKVKNGEFIHLEVNPKERLKDVVIIPQLKTLGHCRTTCSSGSRIR